jgi:3-phosphoglycerate kinase
MKKIEDINDKTVLVRLDLNVPMRDGKITDTSRIKASFPTIRLLLKNNNSIIIMSHFGRPKAKEKEYSLRPVALKMSSMLRKEIHFSNSITSRKTISFAKNLLRKSILMLENVRFYAEEEKGDLDFARALSSMADCYVNDAFSSSHREHASITGIPSFLPSYEGIHFRNEHESLSLSVNPQSPSLAIIGGAKISTKIGIIKSLLKKYDYVFIGGAMMFTILKAQGYCVGNSLVENDKLNLAKQIAKSPKIIVAKDVIASKTVSGNARHYTKSIDDMDADDIGLDIGPKSIKELSSLIRKSKTIIWNGPLGLVEIKAYRNGTQEIASLLATSRAKTIVGGGDTLAIIAKLKLSGYTYVSTSGGAMLEFIEYGSLPGIKALKKKH